MLFPELNRNEINSMKASEAFLLGLPRRLLYKRSQKVFVIGFHKTGTSSLGKALQILGYSVCGSLREANTLPSNAEPEVKNFLIEKAKPLLEKYDAVQDTPWFIIYKELYQLYPNAYFILTVREQNSWIKSLQKHFGTSSIPFHQFIYGTLDPFSNKQTYINKYLAHNQNVRSYFKNNNKFLELNLNEFNWDKLCVFLGTDIPRTSFPHANKASNSKKMFFVKKVKSIMKSFYYKK